MRTWEEEPDLWPQRRRLSRFQRAIRSRSVWLTLLAIACAAGYVIALIVDVSDLDAVEGVRSLGAAANPARHAAKKRRDGASYSFTGGYGGGGVAARMVGGENKSYHRVGIERLLKRLLYARTSADRDKALADARQGQASYMESLLDILNTDKQLRLPAIQVAGALRVEPALAALRSFVENGEPAVAAAAVAAADRIERWSFGALLDLMTQDRHPKVLTAALRLSTLRNPRPIRQIIKLLAHEIAQVREAAASSVPVLKSEDDLDYLCLFAARAKGPALAAAATALGRSGVAPRAEATLVDMLGNASREVRVRALQALGRKLSPLRAPDWLLGVIRNPEADLVELLSCFNALEKTRTAPPAALESRIRSLSPLAYVAASRCLLAVGDRRALVHLARVVQSDQAGVEATRARRAALQALREVHRMPRAGRHSPWKELAASVVELGPMRLRCSLDRYYIR